MPEVLSAARRFPTNAVPRRARITSATIATSSIPGRCFPYFAKHFYCSICLPVCVYNHKEWARDFEGFETKLFPTVLMPEAPPAGRSIAGAAGALVTRINR